MIRRLAVILAALMLTACTPLMVQQAGLAHAEIHGPLIKRRIGIITRRGRSLSPAAEALVAALKTVARDGKSPGS